HSFAQWTGPAQPGQRSRHVREPAHALGTQGDSVVTVSVILNLQVLYLVAAIVATLLIYILFLKRRERRNRQTIAQINSLVGDYFKSHNVDVLVTSYAVLGGRRFVVLL